MLTKLLFAGLFPALGLVVVNGSEPRADPRPPCRCRCIPAMQSYTGILRHVAHTDTAEPPRLALWALEQGKGRWSVHIQSPLVEKKAHQLIDQKVKIQARATISGLIVVAIEPADRA